jgi:hypothetical protein
MCFFENFFGPFSASLTALQRGEILILDRASFRSDEGDRLDDT